MRDNQPVYPPPPPEFPERDWRAMKILRDQDATIDELRAENAALRQGHA